MDNIIQTTFPEVKTAIENLEKLRALGLEADIWVTSVVVRKIVGDDVHMFRNFHSFAEFNSFSSFFLSLVGAKDKNSKEYALVYSIRDDILPGQA